MVFPLKNKTRKEKKKKKNKHKQSINNWVERNKRIRVESLWALQCILNFFLKYEDSKWAQLLDSNA